MTYYVGNMPAGDHLMHYGTKGMKWGQRRYQNPDGSLTAAGRVRYGVSNAYSRARSGVRSAGNRAGGWYKRNKKTIKKVGIAVGAGAAAAGATYLGMRYGKGAAKAVNRAARGFIADSRTRRAARNSSKGYERIKRTLNGIPVNSRGSRFKSAFKSIGGAVRSGFGNVKRSASNATIRGRQNWYASKAARADARAAAKSTLSLNNGFRNKVNRAAKNTGTKVKDFSNRFRKGYKAKSGVVGSSGRLGGKKAANIKGAKQARYPGWMKDTAKAYAGSAKRTAGKAKDKVKSTAKRYNNYMNGDSRYVKSWTYKGRYDPRGLGRSGFSPNYYTRREVAREAAKSFGKGFVQGATPGLAVAGTAYGAAKYTTYKNKKKRAAQRKKKSSR